MFPGMDPRAVKQAMRKLGMQQEDIEASEVIIKTPSKEIVILNPQVAKVKMMGQETWQISGDVQERAAHSVPVQKFTHDDVQMVMQQAHVDEKKAKSALEESNGDIAEAIMSFK